MSKYYPNCLLYNNFKKLHRAILCAREDAGQRRGGPFQKLHFSVYMDISRWETPFLNRRISENIQRMKIKFCHNIIQTVFCIVALQKHVVRKCMKGRMQNPCRSTAFPTEGVGVRSASHNPKARRFRKP